MPELVEVASGLRSRKVPIAMPDGRSILVEMFGPRLTRVPAGRHEGDDRRDPRRPQRRRDRARTARCTCATTVLASPRRHWSGLTFPGAVHAGATTSAGGSRRSTSTPARWTDLYTECDGRPLWAPNDLVFDAHGGFYFTDHGLPTTSERIAHAQPASTTRRPTVRASSEVVFPVARAERHRPVARRHQAVLGRDVDGPGHAARHPRAGRGGRGRPRRHLGCACTGSRASSCSTRSPSTVTATCAWRRSSTAASRSSRRPGELVEFVADRRHPDDQHLLRRRRPDHRVHHGVDDREAAEDDVAAPGREAPVPEHLSRRQRRAVALSTTDRRIDERVNKVLAMVRPLRYRADRSTGSVTKAVGLRTTEGELLNVGGREARDGTAETGGVVPRRVRARAGRSTSASP